MASPGGKLGKVTIRPLQIGCGHLGPSRLRHFRHGPDAKSCTQDQLQYPHSRVSLCDCTPTQGAARGPDEASRWGSK